MIDDDVGSCGDDDDNNNNGDDNNDDGEDNNDESSSFLSLSSLSSLFSFSLSL